MTKPSKAPLLIIFVTVFIDLLGFGIVLPLLPRYGQYFLSPQLTDQQRGLVLGLLMASFSAMQFVFAPIWGGLSDRVGRRPILILGLSGSTVCYALFGVATSLGGDGTLLGFGVLTWLFVSRIGAGIAGATIPTAQAYIADSTGPLARAKGMALIGAAFGVGFTFGPLLGAAFVSASVGGPPSAAPGFVASGLSALALLSAIFLLPESLRPDVKSTVHRWFNLRGLRRAFAEPVIGVILLTSFLTTFAFAQFESTLSLLTERLGLAPRNNFFVFAYVGFVLTLAQGVLVRRLAPRLREFRMSLIGCVLMTVGLLLIGVSSHAQSTTQLYLVLPVAVIGFSALTPSLQAMLSLKSPENEQGEILGVGQSAAALARILGPMVGLFLFKLNHVYPYWEAAAVMSVSLLLVLGIRSAVSTSQVAGAVDNVAPLNSEPGP